MQERYLPAEIEASVQQHWSAIDAYRGVSRYIKKYNSERPHSSNGDLSPDEAHLGQTSLEREA